MIQASPAVCAQGTGEVNTGPSGELAHFGLFTAQHSSDFQTSSTRHTHPVCLQSLLSPLHLSFRSSCPFQSFPETPIPTVRADYDSWLWDWISGTERDKPKRPVCVCGWVGRQGGLPVGIPCPGPNTGEAFSPAFDARLSISHS